MYATGRIVKADEAKALEWGRKAVAQGNTKAKYSVGRLLLIRGRPDERDQAIQLLTEAADSGITASALFLAVAHAGGLHGLSKYQDEATRILKPMAESGNRNAAEALQRILKKSGN